ncbi:MAG TPA: heat-inducible transcriptional repressor HrcA, partial [Nitrospirota bacterium]
NPYFEMQGVSLVAARYRGAGNVIGTLGVIGPTRMAYSMVIPIVDCTAKVLGRLLSER